MCKDFDKFHATIVAIDWNEVYREYKSLNIPVLSFYKEQFPKICTRYTDTGCVPSITTVYKKFQIVELKAKVRAAAQTSAEQKTSPVPIEQKSTQTESSVNPAVAPRNEVATTLGSEPVIIKPSVQASGDSNLVTIFEVDDLFQMPLIKSIKSMNNTGCETGTIPKVLSTVPPDQRWPPPNTSLIHLNNKMEEKHAH